MTTKPREAFPTLSTRRLRLRRVERSDAGGLHACFGDPEAMRYWDFPALETIAETEHILRWLAKTASPYDHLAWAITEIASDTCIGMICYHHREARNRRLELGYIVAPQRQRRGFGTEAVQAVLDYCVGKLGAHRVQALVHPENTASIRLVGRLGFRCEGGPLTDYWRVGDSYRSAMLYAFVAGTDGAAGGDTAQAAHTRKTGRRRQ
ncbi:MAG TPA: GNAT family N-acetyltransferase [Hyphomicrobiaceae bacterium]|jgi:ribosomal-protein-alanine N-acetyltransferase